MKTTLQVMIAGRSAEGRTWTSFDESDAVLPPEVAPKLQSAVVPIVRKWKPDPSASVVRVIVRIRRRGGTAPSTCR